jgi:hypothetical protein
MTKMRIEAEARAAKAAEDALQAESRATVIARQKVEAANQAKKMAESRAIEESLHLELELQKVREEMRANEIVSERLELERRTIAEIEARIAVEQQATEAARQLEMAEVLAKDAANEKLHAHELTINAMFAREELDRHLTAVERGEFQRINTEIETGKLMTKLRKTSLISKVSQAAFAASLVFSLSFIYSTENSATSVDNNTKAAAAKVNIAAPVVAENTGVNTQLAAPIVLASFQMTNELSSLQLAGQPSENSTKN